MNERERLSDLIDDALAVYDVVVYAHLNADEIADHLIANGVTIQKRGRWLQEGNAVYMWRHNCSLCGDPVYNKIKPYNYCPSCGAKMNEEAIT